jgi:hypothetical protein
MAIGLTPFCTHPAGGYQLDVGGVRRVQSDTMLAPGGRRPPARCRASPSAVSAAVRATVVVGSQAGNTIEVSLGNFGPQVRDACHE